MIRRWPQKALLGILASWYLLINCLLPLFHHHSDGYATCLGLGAEPVYCQATHLSHDTHDPYVVSTGISQVSRFTTVHVSHLCSFCTYLNQIQTFKRLQSSVWTQVQPRSQSMVLRENTDHFISSQWATSISLRGPPLGQCWDTILA